MVTAKHIATTRKKLRETQTKFAGRFGVNQSTIDRWEKFGPPQRQPIQDWIANVLKQATAPQVVAE